MYVLIRKCTAQIERLVALAQKTIAMMSPTVALLLPVLAAAIRVHVAQISRVVPTPATSGGLTTAGAVASAKGSHGLLTLEAQVAVRSSAPSSPTPSAFAATPALAAAAPPTPTTAAAAAASATEAAKASSPAAAAAAAATATTTAAVWLLAYVGATKLLSSAVGSTAPPAAAAAATAFRQPLEPMGHLGSSFLQLTQQTSSDGAVATFGVEARHVQAGGETLVPCAACATNAVHVRIEVILGEGQIHVDDVLHAANVQAARCDVGGNQHAAGSGAERRQRRLALRLRAIAVDVFCGDRLEALVRRAVGGAWRAVSILNFVIRTGVT
jgi:hypothetical protein